MQSGTATYRQHRETLETFKNSLWLVLLCLGYENEVLSGVQGWNKGIRHVPAKLETGFLSCERVRMLEGAVVSPGHQQLWRKAWWLVNSIANSGLSLSFLFIWNVQLSISNFSEVGAITLK